VTRAATPGRRARLLDKTVDYILKHGLTDLSLRPLAAALKTSPRMLLYFFGSKERLIAEALAQSRVRQQHDFADSFSTTTDRRERLKAAWQFWSSKESERSLWLFFEVYALAIRDRKRFNTRACFKRRRQRPQRKIGEPVLQDVVDGLIE
jgi:AcrR family transcriptional regulator